MLSFGHFQSWLWACLFMAAACLPTQVDAQANHSPRSSASLSWASLSPARQTALQPLERDWADIDHARRQKWIAVADRFAQLSPVEQARIQGRMAEWAQLSPSKRGRTRLTYLEAQALPAEERKAKWDAYQALPPERQAELAATHAKAASAVALKATAGAPLVGKSNIVPAAPTSARTAVAPSVTKIQPGATTDLVTRRVPAPAHQPSGEPKIATSARLIHHKTLLPAAAGPSRSASAVAPATGKATP